ncbi:MAG TPA: hypothetical protein VF677_12805 [Flavobacterium sp.]|jgi:hypothetical protein
MIKSTTARIINKGKPKNIKGKKAGGPRHDLPSGSINKILKTINDIIIPKAVHPRVAK